MAFSFRSSKPPPRTPPSPGSGKGDRLQLMTWETTEGVMFHKQHLFLMGLLLFVVLVYLFRLWHLQILQGSRYRYQSENNRIRLENISAPRGLIFDRNGVPLVENRPAYHLQIVREDVTDEEATLEAVAEICDKKVEDLKKVLEANENVADFVPVRLVADLDRDCLARIEAQRVRLPGVVVQVEPQREYKWNGTAAHLIGYLSMITEEELKSDEYQGYQPDEPVGKVGVEKTFEEYLHGKRGGRQVEVDAIGRRMRLLDQVLPVPGRNVWLTLDIVFQKKVEALLEGVEGAIVVVDPRTGAVLAMASSPAFDQEQFVKGLTREDWKELSEDPYHPLLNRALGAAYPPGSTLKPVVALAALQEGVIGPEKPLFCPGFYKLGRRRYRCWKEVGHGPVNLHRSLVESCDVYYYQLGLKLGVDRIAYYCNKFGLGERTGIRCTGEHPGLMPTKRWKKETRGVSWQKGETLSVAIGQGFTLATPLQMTMAYAAVANGGVLWKPHAVFRVGEGESGNVLEIEPSLRWRVPVESEYFDMVQAALEGVVEEKRGTAHRIRDKAFRMAGKTGTAQVIRLPEGANRKKLAQKAKKEETDHAWFIGYAPARDPQVVVGVLVEHGGHGSSAAAPLARKVMQAFMERYGNDRSAAR